MTSRRSIAVDIMSGDESPRSRIYATIEASIRYPNHHFLLVGDQSFITDTLPSEYRYQANLHIVHADTVIPMGQVPTQALRRKEHSSMWLALQTVADHKASACVSAGNTGALVSISRHLLKMHPHFDRPALTSEIEIPNGSILLLDLGANVDCTAMYLYQFAQLGSAMAATRQNILYPRVALLNIGEENIKGNEQVKQANLLLKENQQLNYVGYIEGHEIFSGSADVVVCDGFVGNIALKTGEGVAKLIQTELAQSLHNTRYRRLLSWLFNPVLQKLEQRINPSYHNGAQLLGLQSIVIKSHGNADQHSFLSAIETAIHTCEPVTQHHFVDTLKQLN